MEGLSDQQKLNAVNTIFGARAGRAMFNLLEEGGDTLKEFTTELENSGGIAAEIADIQLANLHGQLTLLRSALSEAATSTGTALILVISEVVEAVPVLVERIM